MAQPDLLGSDPGLLLDDATGRIRYFPDAVLALTRIGFTNVGLNFYRDGRDSVAPHNDRLEDLQRGYPIALLSLGSTRRMDIRSKHPPRRVLHVDLEPGSVLLMSWRTQLNYDHGVPKTRARVGPRISAAFRRRPEHARGGFYRGA